MISGRKDAAIPLDLLAISHELQGMKARVAVFVVLWMWAGPGIGQTYFPPADGSWETVDPEVELGWCPAAMDSLDAFLAANGTRAFLLLKGGRIAHEAYFNGHDSLANWYWASAGKTVTSMLVGALASEGLLGLEDATSGWLGQGWSALSEDAEAAIEIRHQLTMSTGLNDAVSDANCTLPECLQPLPEPAAPGTRWAYHNAPYTLLTDVIEAAAGAPLNAVLLTRLLQPTGMSAAYLTPPAEPFTRVVFSTARDMARFGLLASEGFVWAGDSLVTDTAWLASVFSPTQPANPSYGNLWWLNDGPYHMLPTTQFQFDGPMIPEAPMDCVMALGKNDQKIYVAPGLDWVVVRMGDSAGESALAASSFDNQIWQHLNSLTTGCGPCPYDLDGDGLVAVGDVLVFLGFFGGTGPGTGTGTGTGTGDFNEDDAVGTADLLALLGNFGMAC